MRTVRKGIGGRIRERKRGLMGWNDHYGEGMGGYIPANKRPPIPKEVREEVKARADSCCEICGKKVAGVMHHTTYANLHRTRDLTPAADFQYLCRDCHHAVHCDPFGHFWTDPTEMESHLSGYWKALEED